MSVLLFRNVGSLTIANYYVSRIHLLNRLTAQNGNVMIFIFYFLYCIIYLFIRQRYMVV